MRGVMDKKLISVVVPTYNEQENVVPLTDTLVKIFTEELPEYNYEIIFIDNHSKDNRHLSGSGRKAIRS